MRIHQVKGTISGAMRAGFATALAVLAVCRTAIGDNRDAGDGEKVIISSGLGNITIPAPKGFKTLEEGNPLSALTKLWSVSNGCETTHGRWWSHGGDEGAGLCLAEVSTFDGPISTCPTSFDFFAIRATIREGILSESKQDQSNRGPKGNVTLEDIPQIGGTNTASAVDGVTILPLHLDETDRIGVTKIHTTSGSVAVVSMGFARIGSKIVNFYVCDYLLQEKDVEVAVANTRETLRSWLDDAEEANRHSPSRGDSFGLGLPSGDKHSGDSGARHHVGLERDRNKAPSTLWTRVIVGIIAGGIFGLISALCKKKRRRYDD